ncbi:linear amide C-N hydrolase [Ancylobacter terrae]|uniref:linear amide C-N hydrolase n=1 Tax=Ancylobacter sp. sgz301288 TaxID=3342077 RepID=UPI00385E66DF
MIAQPSIRRFAAVLGIAAMLAAGAAPVAQACTGIRLVASDGTVVYGRTMEFAMELNSEAMMVPRGYARTGTTPDGKPGLKWAAKYASVGLNGAGLPVLFDGLNEKGLAGGMFYFPGSAGYMPYAPADAGRTISQWEVLSWALENFASVAEVKAGLGAIVVPSVLFPAWGFAPEAHYVLHDASGQSIVIEYVDGTLNVHDNPLGVVTNSPAFGWHMTNLRNYVNFSMTNAPPVKLGTVTLQPTGQGSGMLGLPGDFTPPSRFVRAVAFSQSVFKEPTGPATVLQLFHVLNQFDIPKGSARDGAKDAHGNIVADYTLWTTASDLAARRFHFRTYENSQIRVLDLMSMAIDGKEIVRLPITGPEVIAPLVR